MLHKGDDPNCRISRIKGGVEPIPTPDNKTTCFGRPDANAWGSAPIFPGQMIACAFCRLCLSRSSLSTYAESFKSVEDNIARFA